MTTNDICRAPAGALQISLSIEPLFEDDDQRFSTNNQAPRFDDREKQFDDKDLYTYSPATADDFDPEQYQQQLDDSNNPTL